LDIGGLLERSELHAILSGIADGIIVTNKKGKLLHLSSSAEKMLGIEKSEVIGRSISIPRLLGQKTPPLKSLLVCWKTRDCKFLECPVHGQNDSRCWTSLGTFCGGKTQKTFQDKLNCCPDCEIYQVNSEILKEPLRALVEEVTIEKPTKKVFKVKTSPALDKEGNLLGYVRTIHDITLEKEVDLMKSEFISTVSHEFRIPLTSIKGYIDLILEGDAGDINETQQEFLAIVKKNSDRLINLINDFLDISRIESGRIQFKMVSLNIGEVIEEVITSFRELMERKGMILNLSILEGLSQVRADRDRIIQVLNNLVSNAIKYTDAGGKITIAVRQDGNHLVISVSDTGAGISPEDQRNLFDKFYRVDSTLTQEIGGSGLGLSICKTIVEKHDGDIWVNSEVGKGSTFSFSLPVFKKAKRPRSKLIKQGMRVLVVDDEPDIANLIQIYLQKEGYYVIKAFDGEEALSLARKEKPDLITLDIMMEGMDGFEVLRRLKADSSTASIPVVVISAILDEEKGYRLGAADYLAKSIDEDKLTYTINRLLGRVDEGRKKVLIVDDDQDIVAFLATSLERKGFTVLKAYDGSEGINLAKGEEPDLILLDLRMPNINGYQVIEELKKHDKASQIPIIVMTAYDFDESKTEILNLTAEQLSKPFSMRILTSKIRDLMRERQSRGDR
jgi:signal transduction histidine kinase/DNA-binding response OmpR family regulator